jgi:Tfp pilus assembly protein PilN
VNIRAFTDTIDINRLAGITSILGITVRESQIQVVEIAKRGLLIRNDLRQFKVLYSFTIDLPLGVSATEKSKLLKDTLTSKKITSRYVVSTVQTLGVKSVVTTIPVSMVSECNDWLHDNYDKVLRIPIPIDQLSITVEVLSINEKGITAEISFVRKNDISEYLQLFDDAGLVLLSLGAGVRDAVNSYLIASDPEKDGDTRFIFLEDVGGTETVIQNRKRIEIRQASNSLEDIATETEIIIAGPGTKKVDLPSVKKWTPSGLDTSFTLPLGLGLKGYCPHLSPTNFMLEEFKTNLNEKIYKSLTQRYVLVLGMVLLILLAASQLSGYLISRKIENLDNTLSGLSNNYAEISVLEKQIESLKSKVQDTRNGIHRTNLGRLLHGLAVATPEDLWYTQVTLTAGQSHKSRMTISGYSRSSENISLLIKSLAQHQICSSVNLNRQGSPLGEDDILPVKGGNVSFTVFEITGEIQTY